MEPIVARSRGRCSTSTGPSAIGFYTTGQLFLEEYYTLGVIAQGGDRHHPHGRQHPAVHRHRRRGAEGVLRLRRPARLLHRRRPLPTSIALYGHNVAETQTVLWTRMLDRLAGPNPPQRSSASTRGRPRSPGAPTVHLAPLPGTNLALMNGLLHEIIAQRLDRPATTSTRTPSASTSCAKRVDGVPARAGRGDLRRRRPSDIRARGADPRHRRAAAVDRAAGLLPVAPGHRGRRAGQQPPPAARHARQARLRRPADERPADGAEHPRMRRRRRPARLPQLGQRRAHRRAGRAVERRRRCRSRTGRRPRTRCRSSATPSRARSGCCGSPPPTRRCRCRSWRGSARILAPGAAVRGRPGHLPDRDRRSWPTSCCRPPPGARRPARFTNVDRTVHLSEKAVDPPGEARADLDIFLDYARRMDFRDKDGAPAGQVARRRVGLRGVEGVQRAAGPATTPA